MDSPDGRKQSNTGTIIGIGCLTIVILLGIAGWFVAKNITKIGQTLGSKAMVTVAKQILTESGIPESEQKEIMRPIRTLAAEMKAGQLSMDQVSRIMGQISEGPLYSQIVAKSIEHKYLAVSGLSSQEKTAAKITVSRFAEACARGKAGMNDESGARLDKILRVETEDSVGDSTTRMRSQLSDDELRQVLKIMREAADKASIPNRDFKVDIAGAIEKAISDAKKEQK